MARVAAVKSASALLEEELFAQELEVTEAVQVVERKKQNAQRADTELGTARGNLLKAQRRVLGTRKAMEALATRDGAGHRLMDSNLQHRRIDWRMEHGMPEAEARQSSGAWGTAGYERLNGIVNPTPEAETSIA